ncbi:hypothetical protein GCM10010307_09350 [Streptomyces vastus]|uniref:Uncharacterized protein n=1 Tax=Streptomyces vastus TaxID=285451 RepID=A0ABN3QDR7_9ACTN
MALGAVIPKACDQWGLRGRDPHAAGPAGVGVRRAGSGVSPGSLLLKLVPHQTTFALFGCGFGSKGATAAPAAVEDVGQHGPR